jgi:hypothetical protein
MELRRNEETMIEKPMIENRSARLKDGTVGGGEKSDD